MKVRNLQSSNGIWNLSMISSIFNNSKDVEDILKIYISGLEMKDKRVWHFSKDKNLSTKSAYEIISQTNIIINSNNNNNRNNNMINWKQI